MRSPSHPPFGTRPPRSGLLSQAGRDYSSAEALLGGAHPLVGVLRRSQTTVEQMLTVGAVQVVACMLLYCGAPSASPLAIAAALVQMALGLRLSVLLQGRRDLCLQLIIGGAGRLPLGAVELECRRLEDRRHLARLARSLEDMVDAAQRPLARIPSSRPVFNVRVIRLVGPQLREIAGLLRTGAPPLRGVALVERLTASGLSPLYGADVEPLRDELRRARYLLMS
jgi:hypothetical protein